jgi:hypothetical protein
MITVFNADTPISHINEFFEVKNIEEFKFIRLSSDESWLFYIDIIHMFLKHTPKEILAMQIHNTSDGKSIPQSFAYSESKQLRQYFIDRKINGEIKPDHHFLNTVSNALRLNEVWVDPNIYFNYSVISLEEDRWFRPNANLLESMSFLYSIYRIPFDEIYKTNNVVGYKYTLNIYGVAIEFINNNGIHMPVDSDKVYNDETEALLLAYHMITSEY